MPEPAMPAKDQLDLLIDSAIATYAEPPARLEDRIFGACAGTRFQSLAKPRAFPVRRLLPWFVALAAAACLLVALMVRSHPTSVPSQAHTSAVLRAQPAPVPPVIAIHRRPRSPRITTMWHPQQIPAAAQPSPAPKLDVFPAPEPMTAQERALVSFVSRASRPKLDALITAQQQSNQPLTIPTIQIEPIEPPDPGNR